MLLGFGDPGTDLQAAIEGFLLRVPHPTSSDVVSFLQSFPAGTARTQAAQALIAHGVTPNAVSGALGWLETAGKIPTSTIWGVLSIASGAASAFHGYRRNGSIGWALWWGLIGTVFPVITPTIALAQGFGKRKSS